MTASSATIANTVSCATLTTNEINLSMPGLSSNIMVNGAGRLSFTQLNTRILGDLEVIGNLTVSGTGGGELLSAPVRSGPTVSGSDLLFNHDHATTIGFGDAVYVSGWASDANRFDGYYTYPSGHQGLKADVVGSQIEFAVQGQTALINVLRWSNGGYIDVHGLEANTGQYMWLSRLDTYQNGGVEFTHNTPQNPGSYHHAGTIFQVLATNLQPGYSRIRLTLRKGLVFVNFMAWLDNRVMQPPAGYVHSDNIHGDPSSLSDRRLKEELDFVSGTQSLDVLSQIQGCTYERPDLQQRRLGLIADEVEEAIDQLAIDNVLGSKWHNGEEYKSLDYSRLVALLIPAVNHLSQQVKDLQSKVNNGQP